MWQISTFKHVALIVALTAALPAAGQTQPASESRSGPGAAAFARGLELRGSSRPEELIEARRLFQEAVAAGHAEAKNALAGMLIAGLGGPADSVRGRQMMEEAAAEGSVGANISLGVAYLRDSAQAQQGLRHLRAAEALSSGRTRALVQWHIGMAHREGRGTRVDLVEAYRWVSQAAEGGYVSGMISRAVMLATGEGVSVDAAAARTWYEQAVLSRQRGLDHALRGLGGMLVEGEGGPVDLPRGLAYLRIAQGLGDPNAGAIIDRVASRVTPQIDAAAETIARDWLATHAPAALASQKD